jgi:hypothetical protein
MPTVATPEPILAHIEVVGDLPSVGFRPSAETCVSIRSTEISRRTAYPKTSPPKCYGEYLHLDGLGQCDDRSPRG